MKRILDIDYVSLPNLIAGEMIVPEMLLHTCTPELVAEQLAPLLRLDSDAGNTQIAGYQRIRHILGTTNAAATSANAITKDLISAKNTANICTIDKKD